MTRRTATAVTRRAEAAVTRRAAAAPRGRAAAAPRRRAVAAALLGMVSLAACGIQESDVVEAGGAATVAVYPAPEFRMVLYFLGPDGRPAPVVREVGQPFSDTGFPSGTLESSADRKARGSGSGQEAVGNGTRIVTDKVLAALLAGPARADTAAGLTTALPAVGGITPHTEETGRTAEGRRVLRVRAPFSVTNLPEAAVQQLVCTTAYAEDGGGMVDVSLMGSDGTLPATRCDG